MRSIEFSEEELKFLLNILTQLRFGVESVAECQQAAAIAAKLAPR